MRAPRPLGVVRTAILPLVLLAALAAPAREPAVQAELDAVTRELDALKAATTQPLVDELARGPGPERAAEIARELKRVVETREAASRRLERLAAAHPDDPGLAEADRRVKDITRGVGVHLAEAARRAEGSVPAGGASPRGPVSGPGGGAAAGAPAAAPAPDPRASAARAGEASRRAARAALPAGADGLRAFDGGSNRAELALPEPGGRGAPPAGAERAPAVADATAGAPAAGAASAPKRETAAPPPEPVPATPIRVPSPAALNRMAVRATGLGETIARWFGRERKDETAGPSGGAAVRSDITMYRDELEELLRPALYARGRDAFAAAAQRDLRLGLKAARLGLDGSKGRPGLRERLETAKATLPEEEYWQAKNELDALVQLVGDAESILEPEAKAERPEAGAGAPAAEPAPAPSGIVAAADAALSALLGGEGLPLSREKMEGGLEAGSIAYIHHTADILEGFIAEGRRAGLKGEDEQVLEQLFYDRYDLPWEKAYARRERALKLMYNRRRSLGDADDQANIDEKTAELDALYGAKRRRSQAIVALRDLVGDLREGNCWGDSLNESCLRALFDENGVAQAVQYADRAEGLLRVLNDEPSGSLDPATLARLRESASLREKLAGLGVRIWDPAWKESFGDAAIPLWMAGGAPGIEGTVRRTRIDPGQDILAELDRSRPETAKADPEYARLRERLSVRAPVDAYEVDAIGLSDAHSSRRIQAYDGTLSADFGRPGEDPVWRAGELLATGAGVFEMTSGPDGATRLRGTRYNPCAPGSDAPCGFARGVFDGGLTSLPAEGPLEFGFIHPKTLERVTVQAGEFAFDGKGGLQQKEGWRDAPDPSSDNPGGVIRLRFKDGVLVAEERRGADGAPRGTRVYETRELSFKSLDRASPTRPVSVVLLDGKVVRAEWRDPESGKIYSWLKEDGTLRSEPGSYRIGKHDKGVREERTITLGYHGRELNAFVTAENKNEKWTDLRSVNRFNYANPAAAVRRYASDSYYGEMTVIRDGTTNTSVYFKKPLDGAENGAVIEAWERQEPFGRISPDDLGAPNRFYKVQGAGDDRVVTVCSDRACETPLQKGPMSDFLGVQYFTPDAEMTEAAIRDSRSWASNALKDVGGVVSKPFEWIGDGAHAMLHAPAYLIGWGIEGVGELSGSEGWKMTGQFVKSESAQVVSASPFGDLTRAALGVSDKEWEGLKSSAYGASYATFLDQHYRQLAADKIVRQGGDASNYSGGQLLGMSLSRSAAEVVGDRRALAQEQGGAAAVIGTGSHFVYTVAQNALTARTFHVPGGAALKNAAPWLHAPASWASRVLWGSGFVEGNMAQLEALRRSGGDLDKLNYGLDTLAGILGSGFAAADRAAAAPRPGLTVRSAMIQATMREAGQTSAQLAIGALAKSAGADDAGAGLLAALATSGSPLPERAATVAGPAKGPRAQAVLPNEGVVPLGERLGEGESFVVYRDAGDPTRVIKIAKGEVESAAGQIESRRALGDAGIKTAEILAHGGRVRAERLVVDQATGQPGRTLKNYLEASGGVEGLPPAQREAFVAATVKLARAGIALDNHPGNWVWDGTDFVMIDPGSVRPGMGPGKVVAEALMGQGRSPFSPDAETLAFVRRVRDADPALWAQAERYHLLRETALALPQHQASLAARAAERAPAKTGFVKDQPIAGYRITSDRFEDLPEAIRRHLGETDRTKYTPEYLRKNIGSVIALQMNGDKPDFYVIGKDTYDAKYAAVPLDEVRAKNAKLAGKLAAVEGVGELLGSDPRVVGALKTTPVEMTRMSDLGYPADREVTIEGPWGPQTKPAGKDAYLVWDEGKKQHYMVNTDDAGLPIAYKPVSAR